MLSVRLPTEIENSLDYVSMSTGMSKNQLVAKALEQYLRTVELGSIPLEQQVQEASYSTFQHTQAERAATYKNAHEVANWAQKGEIWTKRFGMPPDCFDGIYGRNQVVGFNDETGSLIVISRHLPAIPYAGTDSYHLNFTEFSKWQEVMQTVKIRQS
ncbi:hypothetical protein ABKS89_13615 [Pseudomonas sp. LABIM340]|uniref:hypothetical protein n=1 Tax=Pseudomonas sp. LABIM340 TaxID=3156585 RepID=UPI0032AF9BC2